MYLSGKHTFLRDKDSNATQLQKSRIRDRVQTESIEIIGCRMERHGDDQHQLDREGQTCLEIPGTPCPPTETQNRTSKHT
jgi:hypothetical protein